MVLIKSKPGNLISDGIFPRNINSVIHSFLNEMDSSSVNFNFMPPADIAEHEHSFEIRMSLPGIRKEEIRISAEGEMLTVEGERKLEKKEEGTRFLKKEISYGRFSRSFNIGKNDTASIEAKFEDGMLVISIPKKAEEKASLIQVR